MVSTLPGAIQGVMALDDRGTQGISRNVHRNAQVMAGETNFLDPVFKGIPDAIDFEQCYIFERNWITGCAGIDDQVLVALVAFKQLNDVFLFLMGGHTERKMNLTFVVFTEPVQHFDVIVAG